MSKYFTDPRLKAAFSFQDTYIGLSPFNSPAIYSLLSYSEFTSGVWLPQGGMYQVIKALLTIASKYPISIKLNTPVGKINTDRNRATSVVNGKGQIFKADLIIANADLPYVYNNHLPPDRITKSLKHKRYSCSIVTFFWALDKKYPRLKAHNLFLADTYKESYHRVINKHSLPEKPHFYIHAPARIDPAMAPPDQDTISVMIPVGHIDPKSLQDWEEIKQQAKKYVLGRLKQFGLKNLKKHIKFELEVSPLDWQKRYNLTNGSTLGLHHNLMQMGYLRPHRQHHRYKNLYFVGSNTHPGCGVPMVLLSARYTSRQILKDLNQPNK